MDYEKKYKEALGWMKSLYGGLHGKTKEEAEKYFPELAESEDEKVKRIIHSISNKISFHLHDIFTEEEFQCFDAWSNAWLKKQGSIPKEVTYTQEVIAWLENRSNTSKEAGFEWNAEKKELKMLEKQGQKPKWNENDEHHWMMCVACVEECATQEREDFSKTIDWLKSIKKRMEEQQ